jgi:S-adenosylmethionine decarboxylase
MNPSSVHHPRGRHLLLDLSGVEAAPLSDQDGIEGLLRAAAKLAGATPLGAQFHHFGAGAGVTGVVLLQESHISIHTWPEHGFAALDIFMCGGTRPEDAAQYLIERLNPSRHALRTVVRASARAQA